MIDERVAEVGEREAAQYRHCVVGAHPAGGHVVEQRPQCRLVHGAMVPDGRRQLTGRSPTGANSLGRHGW